jgi:ribosomal protein S27E
MHVKQYARGRFYRVRCPEGSTLIRQSNRTDETGACLPDRILVRLNGTDVPIPCDPPELLPVLAEAGRFGLALVGPPAPDIELPGAACPRCGEADFEWLWSDDHERTRCDSCGAAFDMTAGNARPDTGSAPHRAHRDDR